MEKDHHAEPNLFPSWLRQPSSKNSNNDTKASSQDSANSITQSSINFSLWDNSQLLSHTFGNNVNNSVFNSTFGNTYEPYKTDFNGTNKLKFKLNGSNSIGLGINKPLSNGYLNFYKPLKKYHSTSNGDVISNHILPTYDSPISDIAKGRQRYKDPYESSKNSQNVNNGFYLPPHMRNNSIHNYSNDLGQSKWNSTINSNPNNSNSLNFANLGNSNNKFNDWTRDSNNSKNTYNIWQGNLYNSHEGNSSPLSSKKSSNVSWRYKEPPYQDGGKWENLTSTSLSFNSKDEGSNHSKWKSNDTQYKPYFPQKHNPHLLDKNVEMTKMEPDFIQFDPLSTFLSDEPIILEESTYNNECSNQVFANSISPTQNFTPQNCKEDEFESIDSNTPSSPGTLSSSLEAEHKLLQAMGWSGSIFENEEPLTEAEVNEFRQKTAHRYGKKYPKNGVMTLTR